MAPKYSHPFLEGLKDVPEGKKKDLHKIKSWMNTQAHLPEISDEYIYLFLHACYYSHEKTKSAIENYFTIRAANPLIFGDRDAYSPKMQVMMDLGTSNNRDHWLTGGRRGLPPINQRSSPYHKSLTGNKRKELYRICQKGWNRRSRGSRSFEVDI